MQKALRCSKNPRNGVAGGHALIHEIIGGIACGDQFVPGGDGARACLRR
ncbi:hypothetical protein LRX76_06615 [Stenotrophomonas sp. MMGLT7]|nr:hypothetical protein [Stenotrophomonas sp. MMGLT7]